MADPEVLEFDHVRGEKRGNISEIAKSYSLSYLKEEVARCDVRCANCHRKKTFRDGAFLEGYGVMYDIPPRRVPLVVGFDEEDLQ